MCQTVANGRHFFILDHAVSIDSLSYFLGRLLQISFESAHVSKLSLGSMEELYLSCCYVRCREVDPQFQNVTKPSDRLGHIW